MRTDNTTILIFSQCKKTDNKHPQHFHMGFPLLGVCNKFTKVTNLLLNPKRAFYLSLSMSS